MLVTVFACWLAYQLNWVRQRSEFLAEQQALNSYEQELWPPVSWLPEHLANLTTAPRLLGMFGEQGVQHLYMIVPFEHSHVEDLHYSRAEIDEMKRRADDAMRLFPEAEKIHYWPIWKNKPDLSD